MVKDTREKLGKWLGALDLNLEIGRVTVVAA